jgi:uncharacterized membrane protein YfcA
MVLVASFAGTVTGFGTSTLLIPVVSLFVGLPETLLLVGIIHWCTDVWTLVLFRQGVRWRLILAFGIPGVAASLAGARLTFVINQAVLSRILGVVLLAYVAMLLALPSLRLPGNDATAVSGGAVSGFLAGLTGVGGPVRSAFLAAFDLPKAIYLATGGAIALAMDTVRVPIYYAGGTRLETLLLWGLLAFVPLSFIGSLAARRVVDRVPQRYFRTVVAIALLALVTKLIVAP